MNEDQEAIRRLAYKLWEENTEVPEPDAVEFWLRAEKEMHPVVEPAEPVNG